MDNNTFNRKEVKYRLNAEQSRYMASALQGHLEADEYGKNSYTSIYYDTADFHMLECSLNQPLYKEKIRIRYYGREVAETSPVFVEVKKKFKGIVYKRRVRMPYAAAALVLEGVPCAQAVERAAGQGAVVIAAAQSKTHAGTFPARPSVGEQQIGHEIDALVQRYEGLRPMLVVRYDRIAYKPVDGETGFNDEPLELRITFDSVLRYADVSAMPAGVFIPDVLRPEEAMPAHALGSVYAPLRPIVGADEVIMEVKNQGPYPLWFVEALNACGARPSSFSKVGTAFRQVIAERQAQS